MCNFYCCLLIKGWALKFVKEFTIRGLVAYKPVAYKKINIAKNKNICIIYII